MQKTGAPPERSHSAVPPPPPPGLCPRQVETGQTELEGVLKYTNESLLDTRKSSAENVSIVNENMKALDKRLAGVGLTA